MPSSTSVSQSTQQSQQAATSFIPNYSETPILEQIAQYSANMAPQVYQWGMQQFANNQGNIDTLMRNALTYASPQRIATDVGQAEAGVQQASEAARQSSIRDLQSYGIDPSAGRYAELDQANRVQAGAAAAGAGNQQRMADIAQGNAMQQQALSAGLQNTQVGYGAAQAANQFAQTGMGLKYAPLGQTSTGTSSGQSTSQAQQLGGGMGAGEGYVYAGRAEGGDIPPDDSPSGGSEVDDVPANLTAGEFVIPKDVAAWKGQEFFYKLMAQARKMRATSGNDMATGYGAS